MSVFILSRWADDVLEQVHIDRKFLGLQSPDVRRRVCVEKPKPVFLDEMDMKVLDSMRILSERYDGEMTKIMRALKIIDLKRAEKTLELEQLEEKFSEFINKAQKKKGWKTRMKTKVESRQFDIERKKQRKMEIVGNVNVKELKETLENANEENKSLKHELGRCESELRVVKRLVKKKPSKSERERYEEQILALQHALYERGETPGNILKLCNQNGKLKKKKRQRRKYQRKSLS